MRGGFAFPSPKKEEILDLVRKGNLRTDVTHEFMRIISTNSKYANGYKCKRVL